MKSIAKKEKENCWNDFLWNILSNLIKVWKKDAKFSLNYLGNNLYESKVYLHFYQIFNFSNKGNHFVSVLKKITYIIEIPNSIYSTFTTLAIYDPESVFYGRSWVKQITLESQIIVLLL